MLTVGAGLSARLKSRLALAVLGLAVAAALPARSAAHRSSTSLDARGGRRLSPWPCSCSCSRWSSSRSPRSRPTASRRASSAETGRPLQIESLGSAALLAAQQLGGYEPEIVSSFGSQNLNRALPDALHRSDRTRWSPSSRSGLSSPCAAAREELVAGWAAAARSSRSARWSRRSSSCGSSPSYPSSLGGEVSRRRGCGGTGTHAAVVPVPLRDLVAAERGPCGCSSPECRARRSRRGGRPALARSPAPSRSGGARPSAPHSASTPSMRTSPSAGWKRTGIRSASARSRARRALRSPSRVGRSSASVSAAVPREHSGVVRLDVRVGPDRGGGAPVQHARGAIFSLVASAWKSTTTTGVSRRASSTSCSATRNGCVSVLMNRRPIRLTTATGVPSVAPPWCPCPGVRALPRFAGRSTRFEVSSTGIRSRCRTWLPVVITSAPASRPVRELRRQPDAVRGVLAVHDADVGGEVGACRAPPPLACPALRTRRDERILGQAEFDAGRTRSARADPSPGCSGRGPRTRPRRDRRRCPPSCGQLRPSSRRSAPRPARCSSARRRGRGCRTAGCRCERRGLAAEDLIRDGDDRPSTGAYTSVPAGAPTSRPAVATAPSPPRR